MLALLIATGMAQAMEIRRLPAVEANQGVAADATSVYAIDNSRIGRYDKKSGRRIAIWAGDPAQFKHLNSCILRSRHLVCAASNYPDVPMRSEVIWFDAATLRLKRRKVLPFRGGSLTWLDWHAGHWWAGYANYDGKGGVAGRDHRSTIVIRYAADFMARTTYRFPASILGRFAPRSTSGGAWNRDGMLYVTGHDRHEVYAMRVPARGTELEHAGTIGTTTGGQAIGWDPSDRHILWSIDRKGSEVVASRIP